MLLTRFFHFLSGYLIITITGAYPERFLNVCAKRGILIWDVFPCSEHVLRCSISIRGFKLLPSVARKTGVRVKIVRKQGLPVLFARYKKRKLFMIGFILFLIIFILLNQFIWKIEIKGCKTVTEGEILAKLKECNVAPGTFRPYLNEQKLKNEMLIKMPELAWIWLDKSGSKVVVEVKERTQKPKIFDKNAFCNLVALKDGVIDSMIVKSGTPMVDLGDSVQKGDILVSGLIVSDKGVAPRTVQSDGEIYARVFYEKTQAFSLLYPKRTETGKVEKKYSLTLFGLHIDLFRSSESEFSEFSSETKEHELSIFGHYLGLGMTCLTHREQTVTYERLSAESVAESGALEILKQFDEETAANSRLTDSRTNYRIIDDETIEVTVSAEYLENIAEKTEIPVEQEE